MSTLPLPVQNPPLFADVAKWFVSLPHCRALGLEFIQAERGKVIMRLPFAEHLLGNAKERIIHGGVVTALIDSSSGLAICSVLDIPEQIATLDLRIDYLRPATPDLPIYCVAECYRLTSQIAFARATAYQDDKAQPIAHSVSTFMRTPIKRGSPAI